MPNLIAQPLNKEVAASIGAGKQPNRTGQVGDGPLRFDRAIDLLEADHWSQVYAELCELANEGHPPASRIALMLARRGASLFGGAFPATPQQRARWQQNGQG